MIAHGHDVRQALTLLKTNAEIYKEVCDIL